MRFFRYVFLCLFVIVWNVGAAETYSNVLQLDATIKCKWNQTEYVGDDYFYFPDVGCLYSKKDKKSIGNVDVILIPKTGDTLYAVPVERRADVVNKLSTSEIKKRFDIYLFSIDKKHLKYFPQGDSSYEPLAPYKVDLYTFVDKEWKLENSFNVGTVKDSRLIEQTKDRLVDAKVLHNKSALITQKNYDIVAETILSSNLRKQPDKFDDSNIIKIVNSKAKIKVLKKQDVGDTSWYFVNVVDINQKGWISGKVLKFLNNTYPFVGERNVIFSEEGVMIPRMISISIDTSGFVRVISCGVPGGDGCYTDYSGRFVNPLYVDKEKNGFLFYGNHVVALDKGEITKRIAELTLP